MNNVPELTVAMPIYNAGKYLRQAVLSIIKQSYTDWEFLIIDDGSTDNAIESIADIQDTRIRILRDGSNKGLAARLNEAIDQARGKYFARMDQDDVSYPERFMRQVTAMQADVGLDLLATRAITIDESDNATGIFPYALLHDEICARPWVGFYFPHPTWMGRIEWFRAHRYAQPAPYFCEDQELLLRSYSTSRFATVNEILLAYRIRGKVNQQKLANTRRALRNIQLRQFAKTRQWHFAFLARVVFAGRVVKDWLAQRKHDTLKCPSGIDPAELSNWHSVLNGLVDEARSLSS